MSDLTRELIPILFMYGCAVLLAPFIGSTLWLMAVEDQDVVELTELANITVDAPRGDVAPPLVRIGVVAAGTP